MAKYSHINFKPTESMAKAAQRGLDMRDKQSDSNKGMTSVGLARARQLISRETLSPETVKRMYSFFSRHEVDKQSESWKKGDSKGEQAWLGWGGDAGFSWSRKIVKQMEAADKEAKGNMKTNKLKEIDGRWYVYDSTGEKNVGKKEGYADKAEAEKQLAAIEMSKQRRVNVFTTVNQSQIHRKSGTITIKDVVPIVDDIAMNDILYPAMEINQSYASLEDTPAPIGHPMDDYGNYISAKSGRALLNYYAGAVNTNVRKEGEKVLMDIEINEHQAFAHPEGMKLLEAIDKKEPIHVSTGLFLNTDDKEGVDVNGKSYNRVGRDFEFDHVAILLDEPGAATPEQGVGMFVNAEGNKQEVEFAHLVINGDNMDDNTKAGLFKSLMSWIAANTNLLANEDTPSMDMKEKINMLKKNGMYKEGMKDEEVMNAYDKMMKDKEKDKDKDKMKGNSEILSAINSLSSKIDSLEADNKALREELQANSDKELEELAEVIANSEKGKALGLDKDTVKLMGVNKARDMAANCGHAAGFQAAPLQANSGYEFKMEAPE